LGETYEKASMIAAGIINDLGRHEKVRLLFINMDYMVFLYIWLYVYGRSNRAIAAINMTIPRI
jgi:hypothetical protein